MRTILLVIVAALPALAQAEQPTRPKPGKTTSGKVLPLKGTARSNPCAEFGPGFVRIEGTDTCMKIGGAISIGGGVSTGGR
jgi:hypothetical protein